MKTIRVELSRQQFTEVVVRVPDDFDEKLLFRHPYHNALKVIAEDAMEWDDDRDCETLAVESMKVLTAEETTREEPFGIEDISAELAKAEVEAKAWAERCRQAWAERCRQARKKDEK